MKRIFIIMLLFTSCAATDVGGEDEKPSTANPSKTMRTTIVIYSHPQSDLRIVDGEWKGSSPLVGDLALALAPFDHELAMLGSRQASDGFNAERKQRIIYLQTAAAVDKILPILNSFPDLIESAYEKAAADDPEGP